MKVLCLELYGSVLIFACVLFLEEFIKLSKYIRRLISFIQKYCSMRTYIL